MLIKHVRIEQKIELTFRRSVEEEAEISESGRKADLEATY